MAKITKGQMDNFIKAFRLHAGSLRETCVCGMTYFNDDETGYDWEENELDELRESSTAFGRDHSISRIDVGGVTYCLECDCWHELAKSYIKFFQDYRHAVATYFKLEKNRKLQIARAQPLLET